MRGAIMYQVECNIFFKGHIKRARMDICNLDKIEIILGMPWLAVYNPEIDQEKEKVKMTWYLPICEKWKQETRKREVNRVEEEEDLETLKRLVPKRFWK